MPWRQTRLVPRTADRTRRQGQVLLPSAIHPLLQDPIWPGPWDSSQDRRPAQDSVEVGCRLAAACTEAVRQTQGVVHT